MTELSVRDLLAGTTPVGSEVTLKGWVRTRRDSKQGFSFINLHDGSCFDAIQVVADKSLPSYEQEILHRDLKPANVLVDGRGRAKITDFGLAGLAESFEGDEVRAGTPGYMAPEQIAGKNVSTRSDIYALGLVLYELFTGKQAFSGDTAMEITRKQTTTLPTSPSSHVSNLDPAIESVILRCLEKEPKKRPESALAVAAALPGGDPLAAAVAAGETPSPELVAAAGEREEAKALHFKMARLYDIFKVGSGYIAIKETMKLMGRPAGHSRPPMLPFTDQQRDQLRAILRDVGLEPIA